MATFALIVADPNGIGAHVNTVVSRHRTVRAAAAALARVAYARWAYVAEIAADGSYPARVAGMQMPADRLARDILTEVI
jgi:hypothetical protein